MNPGTDLDELKESGRGLFIIYNIMDEVSFDVKDGKNILTMKKNFESLEKSG
ncbi:MAG: ATP-binding protein [Parachlamydiaceae bacterium]|nr:MAG: ATP-binding protein [Parachlamydiaceae bacterium]